MHYSQYFPVDVVDGEGTRCALYVSGCEHYCKGCYNKATWGFSHGSEYTQEVEDGILADLKSEVIKLTGLSILGGEPLHPKNLPEVLKLAKRVKNETNKTIWLWTGYTLDELTPMQREILPFLDVVVDGLYMEELRDVNLKWRGSSNQIIHTLNIEE